MTAKAKRILITTETREIVVVHFDDRQFVRYRGPNRNAVPDDRKENTPEKKTIQKLLDPKIGV